MKRTGLVWVLAVAALAGSGCLARVQEPLVEPLASLRALDTVDAAAVGIAGMPGPFFLLSQTFLKEGSIADFESLVGDHNVIVRAMGMVCLVQRAQDRAVPILKGRLASRETFTIFPGGCLGFRMSEGLFAWHLIHNANYLGHGQWLPEPLLSDKDLATLDREILDNGKYAHLHAEVGRHLENRRIQEAGSQQE